MSVFEVTSQSHDVVIELRYGTPNNFTRQKIYERPLCFIHSDTKPYFEKAITLAKQQGCRLKIFDTYRPQSAQEKLWEICPNPMYVAPPASGSNHTRGVAIDLTLVAQDGTELDMGTSFDDFTERSHHGAILSCQANANRYLLLGIMISAGWDFYKNEWWHYQLFNAKSYPLLANSYGIMTK